MFRTASGGRYLDTGRTSGGQFSTAWSGACRRAGLPGEVRVFTWRTGISAGKTYERFSPLHVPYVLRHTWASWHYAIHRDLVLLQRDGAWESQDMLGVYVHCKRRFRARLPAWVVNVLGRRGAWSFEPALWSTLRTTRTAAGIAG